MSTPAPETLAEGRFRLLEVIGEGGMATVYKAFDLRLQRPRAIKVLSPALAARPSLRRRFLAEAQTMANLEESRVVRVFDTGEEGDRVYIVMELVDGGSLLDRVRDFGPLPPRMAALATIQICESLQAAHDAGIIHRDIKPHNILLTRSGEIRVTDFGIAQVQTEEGDGMTKTGAVMGTWGFMAPEQKSNAKQVDVRADIYSVGATLWALLRAETPPELFMADAEPGMLDGLPEELTEVIKRATRYRREERYPSARDMAESLRALVTMLPEDPELTVPLVAPQLQRPGKPLDTMQQFATEVGSDGLGAMTMVPTVGEKPVTVPPVTEPSLVVPKPATTPPKEPGRTSVLPWVLGGGVVLFGLVVVVAVGAFVLWPKADVAGPSPVTTGAAAAEAVPVEPADATPTEVAPPPAELAPPSAPPAEAPPITTGRDPKKVAPPSATPSAPPAPTPAPEAAPAPTPEAAPAVAEAAPEPSAPAKPGITHTVPGPAKVGDALTFAAGLPGEGWAVKLYFRPATGGAYDNKTMTGANGTYTATVKVTDAMAGGVAYFIQATKGGTTLKEGSGTAPRKLEVTP